MCFVVINFFISNAKPGQSADSAKLNIGTFRDLQQLLGFFSKIQALYKSFTAPWNENTTN